MIGLVHSVRERVTVLSFFLVALILVALPSLDGVIEDPNAGGGWFRTWAAIYVIVGSLVLLPFKERVTWWRSVAWACVGAGSLFFATVSTVPQFWLPVAVGCFYSAVVRSKDVPDG